MDLDEVVPQFNKAKGDDSIYKFRPFEVTKVQFRSSRKDSPRPRSGHRIVTDGIHLYCYGGYNPSLPSSDMDSVNPTWTREKPLFKELWRYSLANRKWKLLDVHNDIPEELASSAVCLTGNTLMIFGGTGTPFGLSCSNTLMTYRTDGIQPGLCCCESKGDSPPGQYGHAILTHRGHFYTIGGTNGFTYNCDIYRLDLRTWVWESVYVGTGHQDDPIGRYRHELAFDGKDVYLLGGGTGDWAFDLSQIPTFNIETKSWAMLKAKPDETLSRPSGPLPRKCHSAVQINTTQGIQVFVAGGTDGVSIFNDVWRLDMDSLTWTLMRKTFLPQVYFHSSTVTPEGCMYTFGGIEVEGHNDIRSGCLHKVWLCIPSLSEICWEAIMHYNPNLDKYSAQHLLTSGVPKAFVERIV